MARDQFMLDTQTGRLWQLRNSGKDVEVLQSVAYDEPGGNYDPDISGSAPATYTPEPIEYIKLKEKEIKQHNSWLLKLRLLELHNSSSDNAN